MTIAVSGQSLDVGESLQTYAREQLASVVSKYFEQVGDSQVVVSREGGRLFNVEITVHLHQGLVLASNGQADEAYPAVDQAIDKLEKRLRRYKRRLKDHHRAERQKSLETIRDMVVQMEDDESTADQPVIVAEMSSDLPTLSVAEAVMTLDLADLPALMFRNKSHNQLNMVYRRRDGHVGWVDPRLSTKSVA